MNKLFKNLNKNKNKNKINHNLAYLLPLRVINLISKTREKLNIFTLGGLILNHIGIVLKHKSMQVHLIGYGLHQSSVIVILSINIIYFKFYEEGAA